MEKKNKILLIIFGIIILGLIIYIIFSKSKDNDCITYTTIKGLYTGELDAIEYLFDENDKEIENKYKAEYKLYLYENGTFVYSTYEMISTIGFGNYIITGNKILLNMTFSMGTGEGININEDTKYELIINDNGNIKNNNIDKDLKELNPNGLTLIKTDSKNEKEFLEAFNYFDLLNKNQLVNDYDPSEHETEE
ncbi:MAG: hypothetical protein IJK67_06640 [Bacilli bacterium]|nr:hypothetical protein [Bacilli bacterium]